MLIFDQIVQENASPLGTQNNILQLIANRTISPIQIHLAQLVQILPQLSIRFMIELVHRRAIQSNVSSDVVHMVACSSQCDFTSDAVTGHGGS